MSDETRTCRLCDQTFPLTRDFFGQTPSGGSRHQCRECKRKYSAEWANQRPDLVREKWTRQNQKRASAGTPWTDLDVSRLRSKQKDRCAYCGTDLNGEGEIDHKISLERGGNNDIANLTLACLACNRAKGARSAEEFFQWRMSRGLTCRQSKSPTRQSSGRAKARR